MSGFENFKINKQLLNAIAEQGYENPTPVQEKVIPLALAGHDIMGVAQTGTGKTAAFLIPIIMQVKYAQGKEPRALIVEPTRELAIQVEKETEKLARYTDLRFASVYGGTGTKLQIEKLNNGIDILIATPGRFLDLYLAKHLSTKHLKYFVIDEADRMMDMGFMPQINKILEVVPRKRQNMLFSATMPEKVKQLTYNFLEFPVEVEVTPQSTPAETVGQLVYFLPNMKSKINLLTHLFENDKTMQKVIIFTRSKKNADDIFKFLERKVTNAVRAIHANKSQNTRINAINAFKAGEIKILVSTDVTARGIDIEEVSHVINFDVPLLYEDYVHRIGRTGRAFKTGKAITFSNEAEAYHIGKIEKLIGMKIPVFQVPSDVKIAETPFEERQEIARELDVIKRKENPDFKGAFHEKKIKFKKKRKR